jgi:hypothetical protein
MAVPPRSKQAATASSVLGGMFTEVDWGDTTALIVGTWAKLLATYFISSGSFPSTVAPSPGNSGILIL